MRIPKKFNLHGETVSVVFDNMMAEQHGVDGLANYNTNTIKLCPDKCNQKYIEKVFLHEMTHFILEHMGENELRSNEKFVDLFANLLLQAFDSMEY